VLCISNSLPFLLLYCKKTHRISRRATKVTDPSRAIAELFLYRAWLTQFGFHIFSAYPNISKEITYQVVNLANTLGRASLALGCNIHFEKLYSVELIKVLQSRWQEYDALAKEYRSITDLLEPGPISRAVTIHCGSDDVLEAFNLGLDYLFLLNEIKDEAIARRMV